MIKKSLIHLMNPSGFIAGMCAWAAEAGSNEVVYVFVEWPGAKNSRQITQIIKIFTSNFLKIKKISQNKKEFLKYSFDKIYFSHSFNQQTVQPFFKKNPKAKRICYGDSFGLVYTPEFFYESLPLLKKGRLAKIYRIYQKIRKKFRIDENFSIDQAVLILPVDQSGNFFKTTPLKVCAKNSVLSVIKHCYQASGELRKYLKKIIKESNSKFPIIFLTENFSEAGYIELEKEIEMYASFIKKYASPEDIIYIKPHPGEQNSRLGLIQKKLPHWQIHEVETKFHKYPIEIWQKALFQVKIISMAYPVLSLKYLYNLDIIQPMNKTLIKQWFPEESQSYLIEAINQYMKPLKKLKNWDNKSPLYQAKND